MTSFPVVGANRSQTGYPPTIRVPGGNSSTTRIPGGNASSSNNNYNRGVVPGGNASTNRVPGAGASTTGADVTLTGVTAEEIFNAFDDDPLTI
jgi:hypothetical protein